LEILHVGEAPCGRSRIVSANKFLTVMNVFDCFNSDVCARRGKSRESFYIKAPTRPLQLFQRERFFAEIPDK
jgi:hypothetical protein